MDMDWSPCKDPRFMQPGCEESNGKPCTRKGCAGVFEKTGEPCQFCHAHCHEVVARFEAFRGFARRAAKKNVGRHANRRMGT
ncbi:Skiv2l2 [Symbiodinium pilosum]|uniref:Skiv2l2 protein n=1 Tax=Symbiodinium pilosum TaxID=2952 RepID=A0A812Q569_SYMPI|nr:Skiv2l2 [Symbiodinium pilosum]